MDEKTMWKTIAAGLELAETGRRNGELLAKFEKSIQGATRTRIIFRDADDRREYSRSLDSLPYMGNKSARRDEVLGWVGESL